MNIKRIIAVIVGVLALSGCWVQESQLPSINGTTVDVIMREDGTWRQRCLDYGGTPAYVDQNTINSSWPHQNIAVCLSVPR